MGLFGLPSQAGTAAWVGDYTALCVAIEELGRVDSSIAITLEAAVSLGAMPIYRFGSDELKAQWLPQLTSGRMLSAFGLTDGTRRGVRRRQDPHDGPPRKVMNGSSAGPRPSSELG